MKLNVDSLVPSAVAMCLMSSVTVAEPGAAYPQTTLSVEAGQVEQLAASRGEEHAVAELSRRFIPLAGSYANVQSLITGLHNSGTIALTSPQGRTVAFASPRPRMGYGEVYEVLNQARQQLQAQSVFKPTPEQVEAALVGKKRVEGRVAEGYKEHRNQDLGSASSEPDGARWPGAAGTPYPGESVELNTGQPQSEQFSGASAVGVVDLGEGPGLGGDGPGGADPPGGGADPPGGGADPPGGGADPPGGGADPPGGGADPPGGGADPPGGGDSPSGDRGGCKPPSCPGVDAPPNTNAGGTGPAWSPKDRNQLLVEPDAQMPEVHLPIDTQFGTSISEETANLPAVEMLDQTGVSPSAITNLPAVEVQTSAPDLKTAPSVDYQSISPGMMNSETLEANKVEGVNQQFNAVEQFNIQQ